MDFFQTKNLIKTFSKEIVTEITIHCPKISFLLNTQNKLDLYNLSSFAEHINLI